MKVLMMRSLIPAFLISLLWLIPAPAAQVQAADNRQPPIIGVWEADMGDDQLCVMAFDSNQTVKLFSKGITGEGKYLINAASSPIKVDLFDMEVLGKDSNPDLLPGVIVAIVEFTGTNRMRFCSADVKEGEKNQESIRPTRFDGDVLDFVRAGTGAPRASEKAAVKSAPIRKPSSKAEVVSLSPPRRPLNSAPFQGLWQIDFVLQRNTAKPDEAAHPWATFDCSFIQKGGIVMGELKSATLNASGTINATLTDTGLIGTMQLLRDDHDWQIFALRITGQGVAEGSAIFAPRPQKDGERQIYLLKAKKK